MPRYPSNRKRVYAVPGGSLKSFLQGINRFLKSHKVISRGAKALSSVGVAPAITGSVGNIASSLGYGARRRSRRYKKKARPMHGLGALSLPGGALRRTRRVRHRMMY